jgi:hypothetical protein
MWTLVGCADDEAVVGACAVQVGAARSCRRRSWSSRRMAHRWNRHETWSGRCSPKRRERAPAQPPNPPSTTATRTRPGRATGQCIVLIRRSPCSFCSPSLPGPRLISPELRNAATTSRANDVLSFGRPTRRQVGLLVLSRRHYRRVWWVSLRVVLALAECSVPVGRSRSEGWGSRRTGLAAKSRWISTPVVRNGVRRPELISWITPRSWPSVVRSRPERFGQRRSSRPVRI